MVWVSHDFRVAHLNLLRPFVISAYITLYPSSLLEQLFVPETLNIYSAFALGEYSPKLLNWTEPKRLDSTSRQHVPKVLYRHLPLQCRDLPDRSPRLHNSQGYSLPLHQLQTIHWLWLLRQHCRTEDKPALDQGPAETLRRQERTRHWCSSDVLRGLRDAFHVRAEWSG